MARNNDAAARKGRLVCNEPSRQRGERLQRVLTSFLPTEYTDAASRCVHVTLTDAASGSHAPLQIQRFGPYDKILVDAPCTSDRHLAHQGKSALAHWAIGAAKSNA